MDAFSLAIRRTRARRDFKERSGHSIQDLLTLVVGTDAVKAGANAHPSLPARWDPKSKSDAAGRARTFANRATLVWTIESVIGYVKDVTTALPKVLNAEDAARIRETKDKAEKLALLAAITSHESPELDFVLACYVWRNRLTHLNATNRLASDGQTRLVSQHEHFKEHFQGLDIGEALARMNRSEPPRVKETTALVRAAGILVKAIDERLVSRLDPEMYLLELLAQRLRSVERDRRTAHATSLWGNSRTRNKQAISAFALQEGMSPTSAQFESGLASLTPREAVTRLMGIG